MFCVHLTLLLPLQKNYSIRFFHQTADRLNLGREVGNPLCFQC